jgi:dihydropteroate synthase
MTTLHWQLPNRVLTLGRRPLVMGIVNVTPDSFSDGGRFADTDSAVAHGLRLVEQGADILDIGGESTRPGASPVAINEEMNRVLPVVEQLARRTTVPLSVDTSKAAVAAACTAAGAQIINDVTALTGDPDMTGIARDSKAGVILMHMQGTPATMQIAPCYEEVVKEVFHFLETRLQDLANLGIAREQLALDPGIGFGKKHEHNLALLARLEEFQRLGRPVCLGVSRKGLLGRALDRPLERRLPGALAVLCYAMSRNAVQIIRVHDVEDTRDVITMFEAIRSMA